MIVVAMILGLTLGAVLGIIAPMMLDEMGQDGE